MARSWAQRLTISAAISLAVFAFPLVAPPAARAAPSCQALFKTSQAPTTKAVRAFAFDIDDNILVMPTKIMIFHKRTGEQVAISSGKYAEVRSEIGLSGEFKDYEIRKDGKTGSHRFFGDEMDNNQNNFVNDLSWAIAHEPPQTWQGPAWNAFVRAMSSPITALSSSLITARQHSPQTIYQGLVLLQKLGYIQNLPKVENIFPVSYPKFAPRFDGVVSSDRVTPANPSAMKAEVMKKLIDEIQAQPLDPKAPLVINKDGDGVERLHTFGFSDDDYGNFVKAVEVLRAEVASGRWPNVKITIFYTGKHTAEPPGAVVIKSDGNLRPPKRGERFLAS